MLQLNFNSKNRKTSVMSIETRVHRGFVVLQNCCILRLFLVMLIIVVPLLLSFLSDIILEKYIPKDEYFAPGVEHC